MVAEKEILEYSSEDEMCYMTFTYTYTYYTDYEQEREVDERLEDVLDELAVYDSTDYSKLQQSIALSVKIPSMTMNI